MTIEINMGSLQEKFDERVKKLEKFKRLMDRFAGDIDTMFESLVQLNEITRMYNDMDNEAKSALPPSIAAVMIENPANKLMRLIGDDERGLIGLKHMYMEVGK